MEHASALEKAIEATGSQARLAKEIGVTQQAISYWVKKGGKVPAEFAVSVETVSGISRHELRPDIFGAAKAEASAA